MKVASLFGKPDQVPVIGPAQRALDELDLRIDQASASIAKLQDQLAGIHRAKAAAQRIVDEPTNLQQQLAAEESNLAAAELQDQPYDESRANELRAQLAKALARVPDAEARTRVEDLKIGKVSATVQAMTADLRALGNTRIQHVLATIRERIAELAPQVEAERAQFLAGAYGRVCELAAAHDHVAHELQLGNYIGGRQHFDLQIPAASAVTPLDHQSFRTAIDAGWKTVLRGLKLGY